MKLFYSTTSPFARKILIALELLNLEAQTELILTNPFDDPPELLKANPLSKIPTLILKDGTSLCDSNLIFQYLNSLNSQISLYPDNSQNNEKWQKLQLAQIAEGILTAAVAIRIESTRPENFQYPAFIDRQLGNITRSLQALENRNELFSSKTSSILEITLVCALDYLNFRLPEINWSNNHPNLQNWHQAYSQKQEIKNTYPRE